MKRLIILALLALALPARATEPAGTWATDHLAAALTAYDAERFDEARRQFGVLADHGSAIAETMLGVMYARGRGVDADPATAVAYFYRAANRGYAPAQLALSDALARGAGTPRSVEQAYFWARLAASRGDAAITETAAAQAARLGRGLSAKLRAEMDRQLRSWRPWVALAR